MENKEEDMVVDDLCEWRGEWFHVLHNAVDVCHLMEELVFVHYVRCRFEGGVLPSRREQLRDVVVTLHGCILGILEGVARLLENSEEGLELRERVRMVRDAVSSLSHPSENQPPLYEPEADFSNDGVHI